MSLAGAHGLIGQLLDIIRPGLVAKPTPKPDHSNGYSSDFRPARRRIVAGAVAIRDERN